LSARRAGDGGELVIDDGEVSGFQDAEVGELMVMLAREVIMTRFLSPLPGLWGVDRVSPLQ